MKVAGVSSKAFSPSSMKTHFYGVLLDDMWFSSKSTVLQLKFGSCYIIHSFRFLRGLMNKIVPS